MRILLTAGPTREPIDPVRYIGNRSSGRMGAAIAKSALGAGHSLTLILGPVSAPFPLNARRIDVETAAQMHAEVLREFPKCDLLIMTAAVSDYRPIGASAEKLKRGGELLLRLESTPDIVADAARLKRPDQRIVGFSLQTSSDLQPSQAKLSAKNLDLIVHNPADTISSASIEATLLYADGRIEKLPSRSKLEFADILLQRAAALFIGS
jgi:phosphopantothenoylcysteine decarboxylase/phosphopantothenate--cysteine ligase